MNIYYHFFDRELRQSVNAELTDDYIMKILVASLLIFDDICYLPISNMYESYLEFPQSIKFLLFLNDLKMVRLASYHNSIDDFIFSRRFMYAHDKERYPMYFNKSLNVWSEGLIVLEDSTTEIIGNELINNGIEIRGMDTNHSKFVNAKITDIINKKNNKALTFSLFRSESFEHDLSSYETEAVKNKVRETISRNYTQRYLNIMDGHIITGIKSIGCYDNFEKNKFTTSFPIIKLILKNIGLDLDSHIEECKQIILGLRLNFGLFKKVYEHLNNFLNALSLCFMDSVFNHTFLNPNCEYPVATSVEQFVINLFKYINDIYSRDKKMEEQMKSLNNNADTIAIIAVTRVEMTSILKALKAQLDKTAVIERTIDGSDTMIYYEVLGFNQRIIVVQSEMGVYGQASIMNTLNDIFENFNPKKVIMVGIAFGANKTKQQLGDVLVSKQVWGYESEKVTESVPISRGDKITASTSLLRIYRSVELDLDPSILRVHFGLIASGEKLINSKKMLDKLKKSEPELIGGDMEAAGLASVCAKKKADWIVIKAISDWAYGKNDNNQQQAADNASYFCVKGLIKIIN